MNSVNLIGNLGADSELKYTPNGKAITNVSVGVRQGKNKDGSDRPTLWVKVVIFDKQAENLSKYLLKGKQIGVSGRLNLPEAWVGKQDGKPAARVVVFADNVTLLGTATAKPQQEAEPSTENERDPDDTSTW